MRWIYISPHLDDVVLSCGGLVWEQAQAGTPVEIWTVVCGVPGYDDLSDFAKVLHFTWGTQTAAETVALRRAEDRAAVEMLGAKPVHFDVPDCIYRKSPRGEWLYEGIFAPPHPEEADLPRRIARDLASRLEPEDVVVCPFGVGGHVDHVTVRAAVELLGRPLRYYADIPYLFTRWRGLLSFVDGKCARSYPVSEQGLEVWNRSIEAYASQLSSIYGTDEERRQAIRAYWESTFGLTLWQSALG
jgi:LmbE family N-acetylglucosaminyl deacetylase